MLPRPCTAAEAVRRALSIAGRGGQYVLGTGDYHPTGQGTYASQDVPWTDRGGMVGSDCAGFAISWCYKLPRHRPGYNHGAWASVSDDLNCNSALEDAQHAQDLFTLVPGRPEPGDLLLYPTFTLVKGDGAHLTFIGHVCIVESSTRTVGQWDQTNPRYDLLDVVQCHGPNGFKPGVVRTDGSIWSHHDATWPKPQHRSHVIRAKP